VVSGGSDRRVVMTRADAGADGSDMLYRHEDRVHGVAVTELAGRPVVVSAGGDASVKVRDLLTGRDLFAGHLGAVRAVTAWSDHDDRLLLASGGDDATVLLWDLQSGVSLGQAAVGHTRGVRALTVGTVNGRPTVVSGAADGAVRLWDLEASMPGHALLTGHTDWVHALALLEHDGHTYVVSGGGDLTVRMWDATSGQPFPQPITVHSRWVTAVAACHVGTEPVIVSGSDDGNVTLTWPWRDRYKRMALPGDRGPVRCVGVAGLDGEIAVIVGTQRGGLELWKIIQDRGHGKAQPVWRHHAPEGPVRALHVGRAAADDVGLRIAIAMGATLRVLQVGQDYTVTDVMSADVGADILSIAAANERAIAMGTRLGIVVVE
jgi:WD40 repeat protein